MLVTLYDFMYTQVREAIGVTISVLCSNIRLYASSSQDRGENDDAYGQNWVELLSRRSSELVIQIQSSVHSDLVEDSSTNSHSNGSITGGLKDDIKWMETVQFIPVIYHDLLA